MMTASSPSARLCPLIAFDQIVGGKYKLRTLWVLSQGTRRYGEIRRSLLVACLGQPPTPRILSRELKELAARGLITRTEYPGVPPKVEYDLTEFGHTLLPVIEEIISWGKAGFHEQIVAAAERRAGGSMAASGESRQ